MSDSFVARTEKSRCTDLEGSCCPVAVTFERKKKAKPDPPRSPLKGDALLKELNIQLTRAPSPEQTMALQGGAKKEPAPEGGS